MKKRDFLKTVLAGSALAATAGIISCDNKTAAKDGACCSATPQTKSDATLNISLQENVAFGKNLTEKLDLMEKLGVSGIEIWGGGLADRVKEIQDALKNRSVKVSAICAGFEGWLLADSDVEYKKCMDSSKKIIEAAGQLGSVGMVLVPAFNHQKSLPHTAETRQICLDRLKELGEFAMKHNTSVILEPLNRQEAFFLRQVGDAASMCRDINIAGVTCMGDFWHMTWEENCDKGAFLSAGKYLSHVHVASRKRRSMPGEDGDADNYVNGFKGLKEMNYKGFVSFECGSQGDKSVTIPAAVKLLRDQWELA